MKLLYGFGLILFAVNIMASEPEQTANLSDYSKYNDMFFASPDLESGTYVLTRDANSPDQITIDIGKATDRISSARTNPSVARTPLTNRLQFVPSKVIATYRERTYKTINLDFREAAPLLEDEVEQIVMELDLENGRIKVNDVQVAQNDRGRNYDIDKDTFFIDQDIRYQFRVRAD